MELAVSILGGGSRGNALLVHGNDSGILVDAGFSRKEIIRRLVQLNLDPSLIKIILVTHEHGDHTQGCRVLSDHLRVPVCVSARTYEYLLKDRGEKWERVRIFSPGSTFEYEGFNISPFAVQHDAVEPVGFVLSRNGIKVGIATDLGCVNELVRHRLYDCDVLVLESNYDLDLLRDSERALALKRRIMGRHGHLDNRDAMTALAELVTARTKAIFLTHISSDCNRVELVEKLGRDKLHELGRSDIIFKVVLQDEPTATVWI